MKSTAIIRTIIVSLIVFMGTSCGIIRSVFLLKPNIDDFQRDPHGVIASPAEPFNFSKVPSSAALGDRLFVTCCFGPNTITLNEYVKMYGTEAFLIIRNDSILYEVYSNNHTFDRTVTSFSISKAVITTLTGIALHEGYVNSIEQPVCEILPDWRQRGFPDLTIKDLLQHTSGMSFSQSIYYPASDQVQFYYGRNLMQRMERRRPVVKPGERFEYHSANTQLLAMLLEKASGHSIPEYLETRLWQPLGMEAPALWSLDRHDEKGMVRSFCCLQAHALDFAKLGRLWLHNGNWQGQQILPPDWLEGILSESRNDSGRFRSGFSVLNSECDPSFYTTGLLGQFIYVVPNKNLLVLRFGDHRKNYSTQIWRDIFAEISRQM